MEQILAGLLVPQIILLHHYRHNHRPDVGRHFHWPNKPRQQRKGGLPRYSLVVSGLTLGTGVIAVIVSRVCGRLRVGRRRGGRQRAVGLSKRFRRKEGKIHLCVHESHPSQCFVVLAVIVPPTFEMGTLCAPGNRFEINIEIAHAPSGAIAIFKTHAPSGLDEISSESRSV